jgi:DHA2 family multidrug resistance protein
VSKLDTNDPDVMNRVSGITSSFIAKGMDAKKAIGSAYQSLEYSVMKQAVVMSYMDVFLYLGLMFLICVPFVLMVKGSKKTKLDPSAMH